MNNDSQQYTYQLQQLFGLSAFREGQLQVVEQLLSGHSSLAIFPTGSGKSLCYQFVATQLPHLTLVVSPLLALMKDQLEFLHAKGIKAASIDSSLGPEQNRRVMQDVRAGVCKILMVSVERFKNERFRQFIESVQLSMLVVDEAHCISEWGHNFRPDYLKLPANRQALEIPLVLLLTATATVKVKKDMARLFNIASENIVQTGFYRPNLDLEVVPIPSPEKIPYLLNFIEKQSGAGIVYVTLQKSAENVANMLKQQGFNAAAYHAGLVDDVRQSVQTDFMQGKIKVVVATIAFGMGIDKSDVRFVVHYDLPKSIENYSQEIGRAGRDGHPSNCVVLANLDGLVTVENFVYGDTPELQSIERVVNDIKQYDPMNIQSGRYPWEMQINSLSAMSNIRQLPLKTLLVQLELEGVIKPKYAYFAEFKYRFLKESSNITDKFNGERVEFLKAVFKHTAMKKVWGTVNFDDIYQEYGAERNRVITALEYLHEQGDIQLESRLITDVYEVNEAKLNSPNLLNKLDSYFQNNEFKETQRIAALVEFFELNMCLSRNLSGYFDDWQIEQNCGHCSVCRGNIAKLERSEIIQLPHQTLIAEAMSNLRSHLMGKTELVLTATLFCRFLTGLSTPVFARLKARQVPGFGICELCRYDEVRDIVERIMSESVK